MMTSIPANRSAGTLTNDPLLLLRLRAVAERLQERYNCGLRLFVEFKVSEGNPLEDITVDIAIDFRRRPAL